MMGVADILAIWAVPVFILLIFAAGFVRKVPLFDEFTAGAADGLRSCVKVIPALVALMTAVAMLQASGALDVLTRAMENLQAFFRSGDMRAAGRSAGKRQPGEGCGT